MQQRTQYMRIGNREDTFAAVADSLQQQPEDIYTEYREAVSREPRRLVGTLCQLRAAHLQLDGMANHRRYLRAETAFVDSERRHEGLKRKLEDMIATHKKPTQALENAARRRRELERTCTSTTMDTPVAVGL